MSVVALIERMSQDWARATRHPFLDAVGDGSTESFDLWLAQDAVFVTDLVAFQARLLARVPRSAQRVLADGIVALLAELDWFDERASALGVATDVEPLPATLGYRELLARMDGGSASAALVGLWALERVYLEAWRHAASRTTDPRYASAVEHWTEPAFADYVARLEQVADVAFAQDEPNSLATVREVLTAEIAFWDMTSSPPVGR